MAEPQTIDNDVQQRAAKLTHAPSGQRINEYHAKRFRWYFSDPPLAGIGGNAGGNFGAMLERAEVFAINIVECRKCMGTGRCARTLRGFGSYELELRRHQRALAKEEGVRLVLDMEAYDAWRAVGVRDVATPEMVAETLPDELTKPCPKCNGEGIVNKHVRASGPLTKDYGRNSKPLGTTRKPFFAVDDAAIAKYGQLSRTLERIRVESWVARVGVQLFFRPDSSGSIWCLWPLTDAGPAFLDTLPNPRNVAPELLMDNERAAQRAKPEPLRGKMLGFIGREAAMIWDHTCEVVNHVTAREDEDEDDEEELREMVSSFLAADLAACAGPADDEDLS